MSYRGNYRRGGYRSSRPQQTGRIGRANKRPGPCRVCHAEIPAYGGQLWREASGEWSVVHQEATQGGWLMNPQPFTGGCPEDTDRRNAELHAAGFFGADAPAPRPEAERIAARAAAGAAAAEREQPQRYARRAVTAATGARYRCTHEDYPCCGC